MVKPGRARSILWSLPLVLAPLVLGCGDSGVSSEVGTESGASSTTGTDGSTIGPSGSTMASTSHDTQTDTATETATETDANTDVTEEDLLDTLAAIDGMTVEEIDSSLEGYRIFLLTFLQPQDHNDHDGLWFPQRMVLSHRTLSDPMVMATSGYGLIGPGYLGEPASLLAANQLTVEQRFFGPSTPEPADWSFLTIEQAANDHHRIVEALAPIYAGNWVGTGASKGGMTSVYHRRFFPDDLAATLAYVAPHNLAELDTRYGPYVDSIGEPECAQALKTMQAEALGRRESMIGMLAKHAQSQGLKYSHLGFERAFEFSVIESRFVFWQYGGQGNCADIPSPMASDEQVFDFLDNVAPWAGFADASIAGFGAYYYQAATQLGAPGIDEEHLGDLRDFPGEDDAAIYSPKGVAIEWDPEAMPAVSEWIDSDGERLMFVYGGRDPWSATAFELGGAKDSHVYWVETGNHGAKLTALPKAEFDEAFALLSGWLGAGAVEPGELNERRALAQPWPEVRRGGL